MNGSVLAIGDHSSSRLTSRFRRGPAPRMCVGLKGVNVALALLLCGPLLLSACSSEPGHSGVVTGHEGVIGGPNGEAFAPVQGSVVLVDASGARFSIPVSAAGGFAATLPVGAYTMIASAQDATGHVVPCNVHPPTVSLESKRSEVRNAICPAGSR